MRVTKRTRKGNIRLERLLLDSKVTTNKIFEISKKINNWGAQIYSEKV